MSNSQTPIKQVPTSRLANILYRLLGRPGARVGMIWVGIMISLAVLAPFIASSLPFTWEVLGEDDKWTREWPLFATLQWTDLCLLTGYLAALVLVPLKRVPLGIRLGMVVWLTLVSAHAMRGVDLAQWTWDIICLIQPGEGASLGLAVLIKIVVGTLCGAVLLLGSAAILILLPMYSWKKAPNTWKALFVIGAVLSGLLICRDAPPDKDSIVYADYRLKVEEGTARNEITTIIPYSPDDFQRDNVKESILKAPSLKHWMGTTDKGADVSSRMIHAMRVAAVVGFVATGIALMIGICIGAVMGYYAGLVDLIGMRLVEMFSAIPVIVLLITICAVYERNIFLIMTVIGLTGWIGYAIYIRAEFLKLRKADYVQAARALGASTPAILFRHLLPNGVTPVLVLASFGFASAILLESTLSFLGLGLPPQDPSWGQLLNEANQNGGTWWLIAFPGIAIFLTVFSYNLIGEALRDALDPRAQK